jgi:hypothetical protein
LFSLFGLPARRAMKNITITLDDETAAEARVEAARRNVSLSRFIGDILQNEMNRAGQYGAAMRRYLSRGPFQVLEGPAELYPPREELHDRSDIR